jgi:lipoprotein-releasing system ATP-binding protein
MQQLQVTGLTKIYETAAGPLTILKNVNLTLDRGEDLAIVGPSGSGKSTLLHLLGALDNPTSGQVKLDGVNPFELNPGALAKFRNEKIGFIFQEHHLLPQLTALENVLLPVLASGSVSAESTSFASDLLSRVGLSDRVGHLPSKLSGGERQRVAVARALVCRPTLLLADEPTGSLDQNNAETIGQLLLDVRGDSRATLICVTHSTALAAMFARTSRLNRGSLEDC